MRTDILVQDVKRN